MENSQTTQKWCMGLPSTGARALSPEEIAELRAKRRNLLLAGWSIVLGWPVVMTGILSVLILFSKPLIHAGISENIQSIIGGITGMGGLLLGIPVTILVARDRIRTARTLAGDIRRGAVDVFKGAPESQTIQELFLRALSPGPERVERFEVLADADIVYTINGKKPEKPLVALMGEVSPIAHDRLSTVIPEELFKSPEQAELGIRQRHLTEEEKEELQKHIRRFRRLSPFRLFMTAFFGFAIIAWVISLARTTSPWGQRQWNNLSACALVAVVMLVSHWRKHYRRKQMSADLECGIVMVIPNDVLLAQGVRKPGALVRGPYEVLPVSRLYWTEDGKPAAWRLPFFEERHAG